MEDHRCSSLAVPVLSGEGAEGGIRLFQDGPSHGNDNIITKGNGDAMSAYSVTYSYGNHPCE